MPLMKLTATFGRDLDELVLFFRRRDLSGTAAAAPAVAMVSLVAVVLVPESGRVMFSRVAVVLISLLHR